MERVSKKHISKTRERERGDVAEHKVMGVDRDMAARSRGRMIWIPANDCTMQPPLVVLLKSVGDLGGWEPKSNLQSNAGLLTLSPQNENKNLFFLTAKNKQALACCINQKGGGKRKACQVSHTRNAEQHHRVEQHLTTVPSPFFPYSFG